MLLRTLRFRTGKAHCGAAYTETQRTGWWFPGSVWDLNPGLCLCQDRTSISGGQGRRQLDQQDLWDSEEQRDLGEGIPSWEEAWSIRLQTRDPHGGFGLKLWKPFVFIPCLKKNDEWNCLK